MPHDLLPAAASDRVGWFTAARYGLFIHYGLYSLIGRGEWAANREEMTRDDLRQLATHFNPSAFDAEAICDLAVAAGMRYVVFTTMHHEGFRLYRTALSSFNSVAVCGRDLTAEMVTAARARGLKIGLYHSLNTWFDEPDGVDALESPAAYERYISATHARCAELASSYDHDIFWFDGWWPFAADGWQAEALTARLRAINPKVLFNPRSGLPGDFATPEGHLGAPQPWRPWEGCLSVNDSWGYHVSDHQWKTPLQVVDLLATAAAGRGNLLMNVGPRGDGALPPQAMTVLREVGGWLERNGEAVYPVTEVWSMDLQTRGDHRGDWCHHGPCTIVGNALHVVLKRWPGAHLVLGGCQVRVVGASILGGPSCPVHQAGTRVTVDLPPAPVDSLCTVVRLLCDQTPVFYQTGGLRIPRVPHPHYDPCPSELLGAPGGH